MNGMDEEEIRNKKKRGNYMLVVAGSMIIELTDVDYTSTRSRFYPSQHYLSVRIILLTRSVGSRIDQKDCDCREYLGCLQVDSSDHQKRIVQYMQSYTIK